MNQDTRKDPRAKVLTMTVRYKSATLDEFIEHHSYDVSRGGMFIKTPSPFPPGTLLKFEVKIADEQRLMQGVGRVVWKREANDSNDSRPAGMGVKFIKIDDESRRTIERLVDARGGDGDNAFDQGNAPRVPVAAAPTASVPSAIPSSTAPTRPMEQPPAAGRSRKATVIGLGAMKPSGTSGGARSVGISSGPPRTVTPSPPQTQEKPAEAFFPKTDSRADMPPVEDQTMMKQAKELLADAMRYAGGTAEDVKAAAKVSSIPPHVPRPEPHKSVPPRPTAKVDVPKTRAPFSEPNEEGEAATTIWRANEAAALLAESMKDSEPPQGEEIHGRITARPPAEAPEPEPRFRDSEPATTPGTSSDEERKSAGKVAAAAEGEPAAKLTPEHVEAEAPASEPAKPAAKPAAAKAPVSVSERPSSRTRASQAMTEAANEQATEGGGGKGVFALLALAAAAGIGFYLTRPPAAAPEPPPAPVEVAKPAPAPEPTPIATAPEAPPSAAVSAAPADPASAAPAVSAAPSAAAEPAASAAPPAPEVAEKPAAKPAPRRVVAPRRAPVKKKAEPALSGEESEAPPAEAAPKPPADAAPEAPPPAPPPPAPPPATPPSPTPSPAAPPLGDNPY